MPLRGVLHRISHCSAARGTVWSAVTSSGEPLLCVAGKAPYIDRRIGDFLRREARRDLQAASQRYADELGLTFKRLTVRDHRAAGAHVRRPACCRFPGG